MFKLDINAIRRSADVAWLTASLAPDIRQRSPEFAAVAEIAISRDTGEKAATLLTAQVIAAAMAVCDAHGDGEQARADMRVDIEGTPTTLHSELLEHLRGDALKAASHQPKKNEGEQ